MVEIRESAPGSSGSAVVVDAGEAAASYVDWPATFAGATLAAAIAFVLHTFGLAIGLTTISPYEGEGIGGIGLTIALGIWIFWVAASSFMAGGYLAGRLRHRLGDATEDEVGVRDGAHGLIVWAVGVLIGAFLLIAVAIGAAQSTASLVEAGASVGAQAAGAVGTDDIEDAANALFRADQPTSTIGRGAVAEEARTILDNGRDISDTDMAYLAALVSDNTGLSDEDAKARVDAAVAKLEDIENAALEAAESARKAAINSAFVATASLLIAAVGAYWAAGIGGRHRDEGTVVRHFGHWR